MNKKDIQKLNEKYTQIIEDYLEDQPTNKDLTAEDFVDYVKMYIEREEQACLRTTLQGYYPKPTTINHFPQLFKKDDYHEIENPQYLESGELQIHVSRNLKTSVKQKSRYIKLFDDTPDEFPLPRKELKKIGFSNLQIKLLDICIYFSFMQDKSGIFFVNTKDFTNLIYPGINIQTRSRNNINEAFTDLVNKKITTTLKQDDYEMKIVNTPLIMPAGDILFKNTKGKKTDTYKGGVFQISGLIYSGILKQFVPIPIGAFQLENDYYTIYQTILTKIRMQWNTGKQRDKQYLSLNLLSLLELSGVFPHQYSKIKKQIEDLQTEFDRWVKLGFIKSWYVKRKNGEKLSNNWHKKEAVTQHTATDKNNKFIVKDGKLAEILYCFEVMDDIRNILNQIQRPPKRKKH